MSDPDLIRLAIAIADTAVKLAEARNATDRECALMREQIARLRKQSRQ